MNGKQRVRVRPDKTICQGGGRGGGGGLMREQLGVVVWLIALSNNGFSTGVSLQQI